MGDERKSKALPKRWNNNFNNRKNDVGDKDRLWLQVLLKELCRRRRLHQQSPPLRDLTISPSLQDSVDQFDFSALTSFLEVDCSFFSPWNWSPNSPQIHRDDRASKIKKNAPTNTKRRMIFQPSSFFSCDDQELNIKQRQGGSKINGLKIL